MFFMFWDARARHTHVEATLNHPFPAQVLLPLSTLAFALPCLGELPGRRCNVTSI